MFGVPSSASMLDPGMWHPSRTHWNCPMQMKQLHSSMSSETILPWLLKNTNMNVCIKCGIPADCCNWQTDCGIWHQHTTPNSRSGDNQARYLATDSLDSGEINNWKSVEWISAGRQAWNQQSNTNDIFSTSPTFLTRLSSLSLERIDYDASRNL